MSDETNSVFATQKKSSVMEKSGKLFKFNSFLGGRAEKAGVKQSGKKRHGREVPTSLLRKMRL